MQHDFILLDRSSSMQTRWSEALGSVNAYVKQLADDNVDTGVTLVAFDHHVGQCSFDVLRERITPKTWKEVTVHDAAPRGGTPLNDATGKLVTLANAGVPGSGAPYDKVAIIIMTDGEENASREFSLAKVKELLDQCRAKGWQVIFLGADFDNARQSAGYGATMDAAVAMSAGTMRATTVSLASKRGAYAATGQAMAYTNEEKAELNKNAS